MSANATHQTPRSGLGRGRHHPLRWRVTTWFILVVDAFAVAFLAGIAVGYRIVSPLGIDAEEGVSMLVVLVIGAVVVMNFALAIVWVITGVVARRRRPGGEPVRRWVWVPVPVAFATGTLLGVQLISAWYADDRILRGTTLATWTRVADGTSAFGGPDDQVMNDVTLGGPGFVVVGSDGAPSTQDAAVWTSSDRMTWSRVPDGSAFGGDGAQVMTGVVAAPPGLVAVGFDTSGGDADAAVWTSRDGIAWSRVPHDEARLGGDGDQVMNDLVRAASLVAVGSSGPAGAEHAAVWTSADGTSWSRLADDDAVFGDAGASILRSVDFGGPWVVAAGSTSARTTGGPAPIWISTDGTEWTRVDDEASAFERGALSGVAVGGPGLIAVGRVDGTAAVWTASPPDDIPWARLPHDESVFGGEGRYVMNAVTVAGTTVIAVGGEASPTSPVAVVWTSPDGVTWSRVSEAASMAGGMMNAVAGDGRGLVAVGIVAGDDLDAAVWFTEGA